jgi:hypothetical protein
MPLIAAPTVETNVPSAIKIEGKNDTMPELIALPIDIAPFAIGVKRLPTTDTTLPNPFCASPINELKP